jgi:hypothetical protein
MKQNLVLLKGIQQSSPAEETMGTGTNCDSIVPPFAFRFDNRETRMFPRGSKLDLVVAQKIPLACVSTRAKACIDDTIDRGLLENLIDITRISFFFCSVCLLFFLEKDPK